MKKKLYVIYKSHLDLGYTDYAENVRKLYLTQFFPRQSAMPSKSIGTEKSGSYG